MKGNNKKDPILKQKRIQKLANIFLGGTITAFIATVLTCTIGFGGLCVNISKQSKFLEEIDFEDRRDQKIVELQQEVDSGKMTVAEYLEKTSGLNAGSGKGVSNYLEKYGTQSEQQEWQELMGYANDPPLMKATGVGVSLSAFGIAGYAVTSMKALEMKRKLKTEEQEFEKK